MSQLVCCRVCLITLDHKVLMWAMRMRPILDKGAHDKPGHNDGHMHFVSVKNRLRSFLTDAQVVQVIGHDMTNDLKVSTLHLMLRLLWLSWHASVQTACASACVLIWCATAHCVSLTVNTLHCSACMASRLICKKCSAQAADELCDGIGCIKCTSVLMRLSLQCRHSTWSAWYLFTSASTQPQTGG